MTTKVVMTTGLPKKTLKEGLRAVNFKTGQLKET
jgi:hypothetical protein